MPMIELPVYATGDIITATWAFDIRSNDLTVDSRTGGDPGGVGRLLRSSGAASAGWLPPGAEGLPLRVSGGQPNYGTLAAAAFAAGTIPGTALQPNTVPASSFVANAAQTSLGFLPVDSHTLILNDVNSIFHQYKSGFYEATVDGGGPGVGAPFYIFQISEGNVPTQFGCQIAMSISDVARTYLRIIANGVSSPWARIWTDANDGPTSGLAAQTAATADSAGTAANAAQVGGLTPTTVAGPGRIPVADGAGKLDSWITPSGGGGASPIPSGLGGWCRTIGEMPTGFAREAGLNGRIPVGSGSSFDFPDSGNTIVEGKDYGNTWQHAHGISAQPVALGSLTVSGSATGGSGDATGEASGSATRADGTNAVASTTHTHSLNGVAFSVSGTVGGSASVTGGTANQTWIAPMRGVVWIRKT
jgi:hypothetical protein